MIEERKGIKRNRRKKGEESRSEGTGHEKEGRELEEGVRGRRLRLGGGKEEEGIRDRGRASGRGEVDKRKKLAHSLFFQYLPALVFSVLPSIVFLGNWAKHLLFDQLPCNKSVGR